MVKREACQLFINTIITGLKEFLLRNGGSEASFSEESHPWRAPEAGKKLGENDPFLGYFNLADGLSEEHRSLDAFWKHRGVNWKNDAVHS
jgi:hypothetical protein